MVVRKLTEMSAEVVVHDPYVDHWYELKDQDNCPAPGHSWKRFFRNQEGLTSTFVEKDREKSLKADEAFILAVPHKQYLNLKPDDIVKWAGGPIAVIDAFGILTDEEIRRYFELGCEVKALGRGHFGEVETRSSRKIEFNVST